MFQIPHESADLVTLIEGQLAFLRTGLNQVAVTQDSKTLQQHCNKNKKYCSNTAIKKAL
jgi:uncharacterized protein YigA (DUF484 family)